MLGIIIVLSLLLIAFLVDVYFIHIGKEAKEIEDDIYSFDEDGDRKL